MCIVYLNDYTEILMSDLEHYKALKLVADDGDHLVHFSTFLQDGLCPKTSMNFDPENHTFSLLVNRFCWEMTEHSHLHDEHYFRVHCGLKFFHVSNVYKRNFHQSSRNRVLNLLSIQIDEREEEKQTEGQIEERIKGRIKEQNEAISIRLLFSGDREIDIQVLAIESTLADFHHPWPTKKKPMHIHEHLEEYVRKVG